MQNPIFLPGYFLTTVLKASKTVPMLFDTLNEIKRVVFDTDIGDFNVYVKYSTKPYKGWDYKMARKKRRTYWNITFTGDEYSYLTNSFEDSDRINLVAIVCTNKNLTYNKIAILTLDETKECLRKRTKGGQHRITVSQTGKKHNFDCFGVGGFYDKTNIHPYVNHMRFFEYVS